METYPGLETNVIATSRGKQSRLAKGGSLSQLVSTLEYLRECQMASS
jgi:hypothetical protein